MLRYQVNFEQLNETEKEDEYYNGEHCCPLGLKTPSQRRYGSRGGAAPCDKELAG